MLSNIADTLERRVHHSFHSRPPYYHHCCHHRPHHRGDPTDYHECDPHPASDSVSIAAVRLGLSTRNIDDGKELDIKAQESSCCYYLMIRFVLPVMCVHLPNVMQLLFH